MILELLREGLRAMSLDTERPGVPKIAEYLELMLHRNESMNLTAVRDPADAVRLHLLDSLEIFRHLDLAGKSVLDVGTGGGMPGVAIALYEPTARVTLLDSTAKKLDFIREACETLGVHPAFVCARAEEFAHTPARESFDVVTARAVAALPVLCELCLPLTAVGGVFAAYKGGAADEIAAAARAITLLGGADCAAREYRIPGVDAARTLVTVRKVNPSPDAYPRAWGRIKKKTL